MIKVYSIRGRTGVGALVLALAVLGVGAALLVVGLALLAAVAVAGGLLGTGVALYRALRGGNRILPDANAHHATGLDPALEVFPPLSPNEPAKLVTRAPSGGVEGLADDTQR